MYILVRVGCINEPRSFLRNHSVECVCLAIFVFPLRFELPWKVHMIDAYTVECTAHVNTHTHMWSFGIRDRAETKELMFTRKIFSSNGDLRRLTVLCVPFFSSSSSSFRSLRYSIAYRCYRSKNYCKRELNLLYCFIIRVVGSFFFDSRLYFICRGYFLLYWLAYLQDTRAIAGDWRTLWRWLWLWLRMWLQQRESARTKRAI